MIDSTARDYETIFEELKRLAKVYSSGRWTDFTDGDFGTVIIHLLSFVGDLFSNQIDTTANELFLFTAEERTSLMEIVKLIGYEPRHFMSAISKVDFTATQDLIIPAWTEFSGSGFTFYTTQAQSFLAGENSVYVYEGEVVTQTFTYDDIDENGQLNLKDYYVAFNTVNVELTSGAISGSIKRVEDARFNTGDSITFSCHLGLEGFVHLQFPSFWSELFSNSSKITVTYLRSHGTAGNVERNILTNIESQVSDYISINSSSAAIGGLSPETVPEMKLNAMAFARTMYTLVTKKDFEDLSRFVSSVATLRALDYLDKESGYLQPTPPNGYPNDAYKVKLVVVPRNIKESSIWYTKEDGSQDLTEVGYDLKNFVDDKRLATLYIDYEDPTYIKPDIILYAYMNEDAIRVNVIAKEVVEHIKEFFGRSYIKIGESIRGSVIGKQVLNTFSDIDYLNIDTTTVKKPDGEEEGFEFDIKAGPLDFIDMANATYTVYVNDKLQYVPDGFNIKRISVGDSVDISVDGKYLFILPYVSEEDYKENSNLIPSNIKAIWEDGGKNLVLTISNEVLNTLVPIAEDKTFKGQWKQEETYHTTEFVFMLPEDGLTYKGIYNSNVNYKKDDYVFNDGYYYKALVDNSSTDLSVSDTWSKLDVFYTSNENYNHDNNPLKDSSWEVFDPYLIVEDSVEGN